MNHTGDQLAEFFKNLSTKIEELQVQTALGKAELEDKWEDLKKESRDKINQVKNTVQSEIENNKEDYQHLKSKWEHLQVQLALGKAETLEKLKEQKKEIKNTVQDLKNIWNKA